jgi:metal-responsive CopG/Arc/MetJ family transcriptional regulator
MKTAISVPDDVFGRVEQMARSRRTSRSAIFTAAAREYVQQHREDRVTERLDQVYGDHDSRLEPVVAEIQAQSLPKEPW